MALNRRQLRFLIRFAILLCAFYAAVMPKPVDRAVITPYTRAITAVSAAVLNAGGVHVQRIGTIISGPSFAVDVKNGCNGIEAPVFLAAAMIAFEAPIRMRLIGIAVGTAAVEILNVVRIVSLYWIGAYRRDWFEAFHLAIWQSVIFAVAVFVFLWWTTRVQQIDAARVR